jgi:hypothetical protein
MMDITKDYTQPIAETDCPSAFVSYGTHVDGDGGLALCVIA